MTVRVCEIQRAESDALSSFFNPTPFDSSCHLTTRTDGERASPSVAE